MGVKFGTSWRNFREFSKSQDGRTEGRTDKAEYRVACTRLKRVDGSKEASNEKELRKDEP